MNVVADGYDPPAHVVVATVVERAGYFLLVQEHIGGQAVINQPAGHWERGETLVEAACREALEETGWEITITDLLGVYGHRPPRLPYGFLRFAFIGRPLRFQPERQLDAGIERALWLSRDELERCREAHRSPMVMRCVDDYLAGRRFPLDLIAHLGV
ncbi:MAG: NUDIX hydrolase [Gammaproteobacteria bacterium]|nr:NUDIX hydrolase [Gammaproteobacteria bacterium]